MSIAQWVRGVDQDQVEVAVQLAMLEPIVQYKDIDVRMRFDDVPCPLYAAGVGVNDHTSKEALKQSLLVAAEFPCRLVAAQKNRRTKARLEQPLRQPSHDRRLARPTGRDVSDTDYRPVRTVRMEHADVVQPVPRRRSS